WIFGNRVKSVFFQSFGDTRADQSYRYSVLQVELKTFIGQLLIISTFVMAAQNHNLRLFDSLHRDNCGFRRSSERIVVIFYAPKLAYELQAVFQAAKAR